MTPKCTFIWWLLVLGVMVRSSAQQCIYHLHQPKCGGTFLWRLLRSRFCEKDAEICSRHSLRLPPSCQCVVNPITKESRIQAALQRGAYRFVSAHSLTEFSPRCQLAVWFREPKSRVISHWGYFRYRRGLNITSLSDLMQNKPPRWTMNQQWSLFMQASVKGSPTPSDLSAATKKLNATPFVGTLDNMKAALCLFSSLFLPPEHSLCETAANQLEKQNTALRKSSITQHDRDRLNTLIDRHNKYDALLYNLAAAEFYKRASAYKPAAALLVPAS